MSKLEIVRAGAGAGKTFNLCETVAAAILEGLDPARIIATTFTNKAAAELKSRIQARLLTCPSNTQSSPTYIADRIELAAIGTVHSVAHQLLTRFAFDLGLSPRLDVIDTLGETKSLHDLLASADVERLRPLESLCDSFDMKDIHHLLLLLHTFKRVNQIDDKTFEADLKQSADRVCELLADPTTLESIEFSRLIDLAQVSVESLTSITDTTKTTIGAISKLQKVISWKSGMWGCFVFAASIEAGKRSGANNLLNDLRQFAAQVRRSSQLHQELASFAELLAKETIKLGQDYLRYKQVRGLLDFTDLEVHLLELLEAPTLRTRFAQDYDLVLVDEFQDTNPIQLAIFQHLRDLFPRSRWVGDDKQTIFSFRGTDPQLVQSVWDSNALSGGVETLQDNHRSQRGLVELMGVLFEPHFGCDAVQNPIRSSQTKGVERWLYDAKNKEQDAECLANGIAQLHQEVFRFGDIAILARTNIQLDDVANALDSLNVPYLRESPGLFSTQEGAQFLAGLRVVADRFDTLAGATVLHLHSDPSVDTPDWILARLREIKLRNELKKSDSEGSEYPSFSLPWQDDPLLDALSRIRRDKLPPSVVAQQVIETLGLTRSCVNWGSPSTRYANLDSMVSHACNYEEVAFREGTAATLTGLIIYLEDLANEENDLRYVSPGHDAVTLMTAHKSKGLEWPVVVVAGPESLSDSDVWSPTAFSTGIDISTPLKDRHIRAWTWPFGTAGSPYGKKRVFEEFDSCVKNSDEYMTSKLLEQEENLRLLYVACTRARDKLVFARRDSRCGWFDLLSKFNDVLDCNVEVGEHSIPNIATTYVLRRISVDASDENMLDQPNSCNWINWPIDAPRSTFLAKFCSPSDASPLVCKSAPSETSLEGISYFVEGLDTLDQSSFGHAVHSYIASLPSSINLNIAAKMLIAARCLNAFSMSGKLDPLVLVECGERFKRWVDKVYPNSKWHVEVPICGPSSNKFHWNGTIDLILECPDKQLVVIDHKSAPIQCKHCLEKSAEYSGQVAAYCDALNNAGYIVSSRHIHFPLPGVVVTL